MEPGYDNYTLIKKGFFEGSLDDYCIKRGF